MCRAAQAHVVMVSALPADGWQGDKIDISALRRQGRGEVASRAGYELR